MKKVDVHAASMFWWEQYNSQGTCSYRQPYILWRMCEKGFIVQWISLSMPPGLMLMAIELKDHQGFMSAIYIITNT